MFGSRSRPRGPDSGGNVTGAPGLRFAVTQFCLPVVWSVPAERRSSAEETSTGHERRGEERRDLIGLESGVLIAYPFTPSTNLFQRV